MARAQDQALQQDVIIAKGGPSLALGPGQGGGEIGGGVDGAHAPVSYTHLTLPTTERV